MPSIKPPDRAVTDMVAILGDSRVFDTYFVNPDYDQSYGYDKTFAFLLRGALLTSGGLPFDAVHIPDHFRSHAIENNIVRLALSDPSLVILCDGIWETLVDKDLFVDYAVDRIRNHETRAGRTLDLSYSSKILADLFVAGKLSRSPQSYAERQRVLMSYFRRRRRQCVWMTMPVPARSHLNRVHLAGNYRCIPEWDLCVRAVNDAAVAVARAYDTEVLDLDDLIAPLGGPGWGLIDQWHFSAALHERLADHFLGFLTEHHSRLRVASDHVSHRFMLPTSLDGDKVALWGTGATAGSWLQANPKATVEAIIADQPDIDDFYAIPVVAEADAGALAARIVVLAVPPEDRAEIEQRLLRRLPDDMIILYPEEIGPVVNPMPQPKGAGARISV